MDKWDEAKLREVVISKAGNPRTTTDVSRFILYMFFDSIMTRFSHQIVCKFFIQAIETEK